MAVGQGISEPLAATGLALLSRGPVPFHLPPRKHARFLGTRKSPMARGKQPRPRWQERFLGGRSPVPLRRRGRAAPTPGAVALGQATCLPIPPGAEPPLEVGCRECEVITRSPKGPHHQQQSGEPPPALRFAFDFKSLLSPPPLLLINTHMQHTPHLPLLPPVSVLGRGCAGRWAPGLMDRWALGRRS